MTDFDKPEIPHAPDKADAAVVLVYATFPTLDIAEAVGGHLVEARLAACVNIIPGMVSIYVWKGARQRDGEVVMIAKTRAALGDAVMAAIKARHPYEIPALLVLPVASGSAAFLGWIGEMTETAV